MKFFLKYFLFFFLFPSAFSQSKAELLEKKLLTQKEDSDKVNTLNAIAWELRINESEKAIEFARQAMELAEKLNFKKGIANINHTLGSLNANKGNYDEAVTYYNKSLALRKEIGDKKGIAASYNNIGIVRWNQGNYPEALINHFAALKIREEIRDTRAISVSYNNIGLVYADMGNYPQALKNYFAVVEIDRASGEKQGLCNALGNIGIIYYNQHNYPEALKNHMAALKIEEEINDRQGAAASYNNIGTIYEALNNYDEALKNYTKALNMRKEIGDKEGEATSYGNIGNCFAKQNKYAEALQYLNKDLELAREIGSKIDIQESYDGLSEVSARTSDYKNAYEFHKLYSEIKDTILNEESSKQIAEMQTKYETEKKEQQITLLNKDKELQDAQLNRQKIIIWSVAAGLLIVVMLSIFIFRERKKSEKLLLNILPVETAKELKRNGKAIPRHYESVTVMFTDFKGFTTIAEKLSAEELVSELDFLFKKFDEIISKYNIEKIKTIGDAYMCVSGLPTPNTDHAEEMVKAGLEIQEWMASPRPSGQFSPMGEGEGMRWQLRMGIHSGPVTAGVVGDKKFAYDIWGDTVNTASRMESSGEAGKINISGETFRILQGLQNIEGLHFQHRGKIPAKNKGEIDMYFVEKS